MRWQITQKSKRARATKIAFNFPIACTPLQPLLIPAQLMVGCCTSHRCSSSLFLCATCFSLTTFAVTCLVVGWLLCCALFFLLFTFAVTCSPLATFVDPRSVVLAAAIAVIIAIAIATTAATTAAIDTAYAFHGCVVVIAVVDAPSLVSSSCCHCCPFCCRHPCCRRHHFFCCHF